MNNIWLIGAGLIAVEHARAMAALSVDFTVIGLGERSAHEFTKTTGIPVETGGLANALENKIPPQVAVLAIPITDLADAALSLIKVGVQHLLIEKPGSLSIEALKDIRESAVASGCLVWIAYNRRFYESTWELSQIIKVDGGVTSVFFEFNEPKKLLQSDSYPEEVRQRWFVANSTHVVDLVFHLCGHPTDWRSWSSGAPTGHQTSSRFAGAGTLDSGALFSYLSDWEAPGRWGIEIMTVNHRLILRPMEKLNVMRHGSFDVEEVDLDDSLDVDFKPGFFRQMEAFLNEEHSQLCSIEEHVKNMDTYFKIANYKS
ncbi:MAG: Gfo/Idh/MocA family oxidoreductase [Candidatus Nanopelagicales bacterium]|nr:Gfo/Idh/MocA family oxidoreductase [Candidatus Nanopelagicales bacterium]